MQNRNPDVLECLANLSNDEVFTPPKIVNNILDMLPQEIFRNPNTKFLDPCCKSGVFLREIAKRLIKGLEDRFPDLQTRLNHIYTKQLYGIATTELTHLLTKRSLYCSKNANNKYSICIDFKDKDGNIKYNNAEHNWENGKCKYCGANKELYNEKLESHAYQFIHINNPEDIFKMKFDVIIGNPPYQIEDSGNGASSKPLYHLFIEQAKKMNPRFLTMIVPSRWFSGGKGLDDFRDNMLKDNRIRVIHDYLDASECFSGVEIKGGVNYFLWDRDNKGDCEIYTHKNGEIISKSTRPLLEEGCDIFVRYNGAISILRKVKSLNEKTMDNLVSSRKPFGFETNFENYKLEPFDNSIKLYYNGWQKEGLGYVDKDLITNNKDLINKYKVLLPEAIGEGGFNDILKPFIAEPDSCCTETYLVINSFDNKKEAENLVKYIETKFFRFLVALIKNTQHATKKVYSFVPIQDWNEEWTDEKLYNKYKLSNSEIDFIEGMIKEMK